MTQREVLQSVLNELKHIKTHMPNGEMKIIVSDMKDLKEDLSEMKYMMLNPEDGVVVKTNQNTAFRTKMEDNEKEFISKMNELEDIKRWKASVTKALWIIFGSLTAIVIRILMMHADKV